MSFTRRGQIRTSAHAPIFIIIFIGFVFVRFQEREENASRNGVFEPINNSIGCDGFQSRRPGDISCIAHTAQQRDGVYTVLLCAPSNRIAHVMNV